MEVYAAGAAAAFTVDVLVYPLDTIKTRYQSQDFSSAYSATSQAKPLALRGLYQGVGSVILATLPAAGVFFSTYESMKTVFSKSLPVPEPVVHSLASGVAEMASCLVLAPAEVIKQNAQMLQTQRSKSTPTHSTSLQAFRNLTKAGASQRLFTGYTALVARNLPFTALQFPVFEHIRSRLWARGGGGGGGGGEGQTLLATGAIAGTSAGSAGAMAAFLTTPSDVVKTRMMVGAGSENESERNKGAWTVTKEVYRARGIKGLFRGGLFRSAWTALGSGLYLGTYDVAKVYLGRRKGKIEEAVGL